VKLEFWSRLRLDQRPAAPSRRLQRQRARQGWPAAAKARGTKLGVPKGTKVKGSQVGRVLGAAANAAKADAFAKQMRPIFDELAGLSAAAAARELERRGYPTARGGKWSARHVIRIRRRLEA
jgi:Recombinase